MIKDTSEKVDEMIMTIEHWLKSHDYRHIECNYVPPRMFTRNRKINFLLRTFFRLCPVNLRSNKDIKEAPLTPQANVAMAKAFIIKNDKKTLNSLYQRLFNNLRSPATKNFSLRQGIRISVNLYEDSADDPTPLNTVWFGECLLDDRFIDEVLRKKTLLSICEYLLHELGYKDYGEAGVYFYYGHGMRDIIYNASAVMSAFLIRCGLEFNIDNYVKIGRRGIEYIVANQNDDGSWFYYGPPLKKAIDGFHQSYILKALIEARKAGIDGLDDAIARGSEFYRTQFYEAGSCLVPQRYDKRFNPKNTWLFQKNDGRDISEALVFFSLYEEDKEQVEMLINYMYDRLYIPKKGRMVSDIFIYGRNRNEYIEFYAWYLHALYCVKNTFFRHEAN